MPHTPGPWTYAYEGSGSHNVYDMANDNLVAECGCDYGHDESFANGLLIAAAPEMHALLKEIQWTTSMFNSNPICPSCDRGEEGGHEPDCKLAAVLKAVEGEA
jgi:hypothetical protein